MLTPLICAKYAWLRLAPAAGCYNKVNLYSLSQHLMCQRAQGGSTVPTSPGWGGRGASAAAAHLGLAPVGSSLMHGVSGVMI